MAVLPLVCGVRTANPKKSFVPWLSLWLDGAGMPWPQVTGGLMSSGRALPVPWAQARAKLRPGFGALMPIHEKRGMAAVCPCTEETIPLELIHLFFAHFSESLVTFWTQKPMTRAGCETKLEYSVKSKKQSLKP